jgi:hypothetical protein
MTQAGSSPEPVCHLVAITALYVSTSGGETRASENPASRIQLMQSAPLKSKPPRVSMSMFRLISSPGRWTYRASVDQHLADDQ